MLFNARGLQGPPVLCIFNLLCMELFLTPTKVFEIGRAASQDALHMMLSRPWVFDRTNGFISLPYRCLRWDTKCWCDVGAQRASMVAGEHRALGMARQSIALASSSAAASPANAHAAAQHSDHTAPAANGARQPSYTGTHLLPPLLLHLCCCMQKITI